MNKHTGAIGHGIDDPLTVRFRDTVAIHSCDQIVESEPLNRRKGVIRLTQNFLAVEMQLNHAKFGHQRK